MAIQKIDPVGRIEGHMGVEVDSLVAPSNTYTPGDWRPVTDAWVQGEMYRGFENILKDRPPQDAVQLTQRI